MDPAVKKAIVNAVKTEPFPSTLGISLLELEHGHSVVEMVYDPEKMNNIYGRAHGGAVFALIDEAFETSSQTDGTVAVALNVNVTYVASPEPGLRLKAESTEISRTKKTITFNIEVEDENNRKIALCQALAYRTGKPIPFL